MTKKIYTIIEEWDNCADYPEDLHSYQKILVSTNSIEKAKQIIFERKELAMSLLDARYLGETEYELKYELNSEWFVSCRIVYNEFGIEHTYCGDSYCWSIVENDFIYDES